MTKLIILSLLATAALLYVASPKLTLKPFSLSFANGWYALGFMFIMIGIGLVRYQGYVEGLVTALEWIKTYGPCDELTVKFIDNALAKYKEVGNG